MPRGHWVYKDGHPVFIEEKGISSSWFKDTPSDVYEVDFKKYIIPKTEIKKEVDIKNSELFKHRIKESKQVKDARKTQGEYIRKIATKSLIGVGATFLSGITLNPIPLLAYKVYLAGNTSYAIAKKINESDLDKKLILAKESLKEGIDDFSHLEIKNFVASVSTILDSSGFTTKLSQETSFDPQFVKDSFENIMSNLLEGGVHNIIVPMVDAL